MEFHTRGLGSSAARSSPAAEIIEIQFRDQSRALRAILKMCPLFGLLAVFGLHQALL